MANVQEESRAPHTTSSLAERVGRRYLFFFLLVPVLGYIVPFLAERYPPLNKVSVSYWGSILDYGYDRDRENADVVLFGDSSAIYDVDTPRISRELGLKVINLPGTMGSLPITGDRALRRYLAGNRPPRLIVFYFAPWDLDFNAAQNPFSYEGDEQVVRHGTRSEILRLVRTRPVEMFLFPWRFYAVPRLGEAHPQVQQGHAANPKTVPLHTPCTLPRSYVLEQGTESALQLVRDYTSPQTKTMIYLAALPDCRYAAEVAAKHYAGIDAAAPAVLPHRDFAEDPYFVHALAAPSAQTTDLLAEAIRKALAK